MTPRRLKSLTERQQIRYLQQQAASSSYDGTRSETDIDKENVPLGYRTSAPVDEAATLGCLLESTEPPLCWIARREVPTMGSIVAVHAHPGNDASASPRWYRARITKVLLHRKKTKSRAKNSKGSVQAKYDIDGSLDYLQWPDHDNIRLVRMAPKNSKKSKKQHTRPHLVFGSRGSGGGGCGCERTTGVSDWDTITSVSGGRCVLSGVVAIVTPSAASMDSLARDAALPLDGDFHFMACSRRSGEAMAETWLASYKKIADVLLPAMRGRNHLFHITYARDTTTLVVLNAAQDECVGGVTFRLLRAGRAVVADVLSMAVAQRGGVCGRGLGTRLVNLLKNVTIHEARRLAAASPSPANPMRCYIVTQAENLPKATNFWRKMRLQPGRVAEHVTQHLHQADPDKVAMYDCATDMLTELFLGENPEADDRNFVQPRASARAQMVPTPPPPSASEVVAAGPAVESTDAGEEAGSTPPVRRRSSARSGAGGVGAEATKSSTSSSYASKMGGEEAVEEAASKQEQSDFDEDGAVALERALARLSLGDDAAAAAGTSAIEPRKLSRALARLQTSTVRGVHSTLSSRRSRSGR